MTEEYPEKTCTIDRLVTHEKLVAATLAGTKTEPVSYTHLTLPTIYSV